MEEGGIEISLKAHEVFEIAGVPITNTILMSWLVVAILVCVAVFVGMSLRKIPGRTQVLFESAFEYILSYMEETLESRQLAMRYFPLVVTLFLFILVGNWLGLIPGIEAVGIAHEVEGHTEWTTLFHPVSTDLNFTLALAIISFVTIQFSGILILGFLKYGGKFVNFSSAMGFGVGLIDLISELARLVSFSFRLFGNIFAGKVLLLVVTFFVPLILPIPLMLFEIFVGFIQAAIFALLTLFFIKIAISEPH
jgi:F-type H+-transporting ATPase subunit a